MKVNHSTLSEVDEEIILNDENERLGTMDEIITAEKEKSEVMKNDELGAKLEEEKKAREIMDSYGIEFFSDSMLDFNQIRKLNKVCDIGKIYNNVKLDKNESKEIIIDLNEYCNVTEFNYLILKRTTLYDLDEYKIKTFYFILDKKTSIYTLFGSLFINRFTKINLRIINPDGSEPIFKIKIDYKLVEDRFSNEILLILLDTKDFEFELEIIDRLNNVNYYNNNLLKDKIFANLSLFKVTVPSIASPAPGVESFDNMNFNSKYIVESLDERFLFDPDFISTGKNLQLLKKFTKTTFDDTLVIPETFRIYISSDEVRYIFIPKIELEHNLFFSQGNFTIEDKNTGYRSLVLTYWDKNTSFNSQNLSFDMEFLYDKDYKKIYIQDVRATDIDDNHITSGICELNVSIIDILEEDIPSTYDESTPSSEPLFIEYDDRLANKNIQIKFLIDPQKQSNKDYFKALFGYRVSSLNIPMVAKYSIYIYASDEDIINLNNLNKKEEISWIPKKVTLEFYEDEEYQCKEAGFASCADRDLLTDTSALSKVKDDALTGMVPRPDGKTSSFSYTPQSYSFTVKKPELSSVKKPDLSGLKDKSYYQVPSNIVDVSMPAISDINLDKIDLEELSKINDVNLPELEFDNLKFKNVSTNEYKMMLIIQLLKNNIDNFLQSKSYGLTGLNNDSSEMPSDYYSSVYKDMDIIITDKDDIDERLDIFDKMEVLQAILLKVNNQLNINIQNLDSNNIKLIKNSSDIARNNTMVNQFTENIQSTKETLDRVNDFLNSFKDDEVFKQKLVDLGFTRMNTPIKLKEMDTNKESSRFKLLN